MEAYKAIVTKRDRREFDSKPIAAETVRRILQAGRMAGSSRNSQPCRFIVLQKDRATIEALSKCGPGTAPMVRAPLVVAVLLKTGESEFDVGRAVQNMFIAAWSEGITSVPQGIMDREQAQAALAAPQGFTVAMAAAFGYQAVAPAAAASRPRLPFDELVHWERW